MTRIVTVDVPPMDTGVPVPRLVSDGASAAIVYRTPGRTMEEMVPAAVSFFGISHMTFGYPNDEGLVSHPLEKYGLGYYDLQEVYESPSIEQFIEMLKVTYSPETDFSGLRHFIWVFHDETFETICSGFKVLSGDEAERLDSLTNQWFGAPEISFIPEDQVWKPESE